MAVNLTVTDAFALELQRVSFPQIVDNMANLCLGFYSKCSHVKKGVIRNFILSLERMKEEEMNKVYSREIEKLKTTLQGRNRDYMLQRPDQYLEHSLREVYHLEMKLLHEELRAQFGKIDFGEMKLKIDSNTYVRDRWLEALLNKEQLTGEAREEEKKKILDDPWDFEIFTSNTGFEGLGGNRGAFSTFTEAAMKELEKKASAILVAAGVDYKMQGKRWKIAKQQAKIKEVLRDERMLLLMSNLYQLFGYLQYVRGSSVEKLAAMCSPASAGRESAYVQLPQELKERFEIFQSTSAKAPASPPAISKENAQALPCFTAVFYEEVKLIYHCLKSFISLLELHLNEDFSPIERERAGSIKDGSKKLTTSGSKQPAAAQEAESPLELSGRGAKERGSGAIVAPGVFVNSRRKGSFLKYSASKEAVPLDEKAAEINTMQSFLEVLKTALVALRAINKYKKNPVR